jgi:hypothetical protein
MIFFFIYLSALCWQFLLTHESPPMKVTWHSFKFKYYNITILVADIIKNVSYFINIIK